MMLYNGTRRPDIPACVVLGERASLSVLNLGLTASDARIAFYILKLMWLIAWRMGGINIKALWPACALQKS